MLTTFDPQRTNFHGEFTRVECLDPTTPDHVPNLVLDPSKPFTIECEWRLTGADVPLYMAALDDNWIVECFAESLGPGPELRIGTATVPKGSVSGTTRTFSATVNVPAGTLPEGAPSSTVSGIYKLVTAVFLNSSIGAVGYDITGFAEGPVIKVENPI